MVIRWCVIWCVEKEGVEEMCGVLVEVCLVFGVWIYVVLLYDSNVILLKFDFRGRFGSFNKEGLDRFWGFWILRMVILFYL